MNVIFGICFSVSVLLLVINSPDTALSAMLAGGEKAMTLSLKLTVIYAVWLGIFELLSECGLAKKIAKLLTPFNRFLFGKVSPKASEYISLNITSNMLGMSGATTPMGIKAIRELERDKDTAYQIAMFFVINATSVQILPTSVMSLRTSLGSLSPSDIILPTILATLLSSVIGIILVKIFCRKVNR